MNSFGKIFRISIFGESHGEGIGVVIDGCPPGIPFPLEDLTTDLSRRKSGARGTTPRIEDDNPEILSGVYNGKTTGSPLTIFFKNKNTRSGDYESLKNIPRPGHADFVALKKFKGFADPRGGGHFSGRLTLAIVAAGCIAKKILPHDVLFQSEILEIGGSKDYESILNEAIEEGESLGGIVEVKVSNLPCGLGEPFFDSFESLLSHLVFSVPAVKAIEFGSGFKSATMKGSIHNDPIISDDGKTLSNNSGGINGGITNGNDLLFRVAIKPTASIAKSQKSLNLKTGQIEEFTIKGRHDSAIVLRTPVIFEACAAIVAADMYLIYKSYNTER